MKLFDEIEIGARKTVVFENGERLSLPPGRYRAAAFGVVIDQNAQRCVATPESAWKVGQ